MLALIGAIIGIGLVIGMTSIRDGGASAQSDTAESIQDLKQPFSLTGICGQSSQVDRFVFCDQSGSIDFLMARPSSQEIAIDAATRLPSVCKNVSSQTCRR